MENKNTQRIPGLFTPIPKAIWDYDELDSVDRDIYHALLAHRNSITGLCFPAQSRIGDLVGLHRSNVNIRIGKMSKLGLVNKMSSGGSCRYTFSDFERVAVALHPSSTGTTRGVVRAGHKQEEANKNIEQFKANTLYYYKDKCFIDEDGSITIWDSHQKKRLGYGGGDDKNFRFNDLRGSPAKLAAVNRFRRK